MWPFKKSPPDTSLQDGVNLFKSFRDIGQTFNYLGRKCIVTSHTDWMPMLAAASCYYPCLKADYADEHGIIRQISFRLNELASLKAENP